MGYSRSSLADPGRVPREVRGAEARARERVLRGLPTETELAFQVQGVCFEGLELLQALAPGRPWQRVVAGLATRSFNSIRMAHDAILSGYPVQAVILTRAVYEDLVTASYVR